MKNFIVVLFLAFSGFVLMSNSGGRGSVTGQGATQAPGDNLTCASSSCHGVSNFDPMIEIAVLDEGTPITEYRPGDVYDMVITVNNTGNPSRFGFQMTAVVNSDNSGAGSFDNLGDNVKSLMLNSRTYLEHNGFTNMNQFASKWTAPDAGTGQVDIYAAGIAANGNGGTSGDGGNFSTLVLAEDDLSSVEWLSQENINIFPSPALDIVNIDVDLEHNLNYSIINMDGKKCLSGNLTNRNNIIDIETLSDGLYIIRLYNDRVAYTQKIYKEAF